MKDFDTGWQVFVRRARQAPSPGEQAPAGFATRVARIGLGPAAVPLEIVWQQMVYRLLAAAVAVLLVCAGIEGPYLKDKHPLQPDIENTVAQLVWSL